MSSCVLGLHKLSIVQQECNDSDFRGKIEDDYKTVLSCRLRKCKYIEMSAYVREVLDGGYDFWMQILHSSLTITSLLGKNIPTAFVYMLTVLSMGTMVQCQWADKQNDY